MKRYINVPACMLLSLIVCSITNISCTFGTTDKSKGSINCVHDVIAGINTYHANMITRIYPSAVADNNAKVDDFDYDNFMEIKSTVFGESGKKMKLVTIMSPQECDTEIEITLVFDGTWLWVQNKTTEYKQMRSIPQKFVAMKIHIPSVSPDPLNKPFDTFYGISGTGLHRSKDLPGTFTEILENYDLKKNLSFKNSGKLLFKGHRKTDLQVPEMKGVNKELKELMERTTQFCKLWVSKKSSLITAYSKGESDKWPAIHTEIEYLSVNEKLPEDTFNYCPPEGVEVRDITSAVLKKKEMIEKKR
jgi:outer membrane lipoprotein-sorting protein